MQYFSVIVVNDEENVNATSSEILADVLKQLDKLNSEKRNQILKRLKGSLQLTDAATVGGMTSEKAVSTTTLKSLKVTSSAKPEAESIQDEVEMLDLHEPKLGTYKRKRSEYPVWKSTYKKMERTYKK